MARLKERHIFGVGDRLALAIKREGVKLCDLSRQTGVDIPHIIRMTHGDSTMHEFEIARLCVALNISADWLLGITEIDARRERSDAEMKPSAVTAASAISAVQEAAEEFKGSETALQMLAIGRTMNL